MTIDPGIHVVPDLTGAQRLRIAREYAHLEQIELAERARISRATISAAERGHRVPSSATITLWAWACGVSRQWLETGETPSPGGDGASVVRPEGFEPPTFWTGAQEALDLDSCLDDWEQGARREDWEQAA